MTLSLPPSLVNHVSIWIYDQINNPLYGDDTVTTPVTTLAGSDFASWSGDASGSSNPRS